MNLWHDVRIVLRSCKLKVTSTYRSTSKQKSPSLSFSCMAPRAYLEEPTDERKPPEVHPVERIEELLNNPQTAPRMIQTKGDNTHTQSTTNKHTNSTSNLLFGTSSHLMLVSQAESPPGLSRHTQPRGQPSLRRGCQPTSSTDRTHRR